MDAGEQVLGTFSSNLATPQVPPSGTADYLSKEFAVPQALRGQVGELIFRLTFPTGEPARVSGHARIWVDDIAFTPTGSPLQVDGTLSTAEGEGQKVVTESTLVTLLQAAQGQWSSLVHVPNGKVGVEPGQVGIAAASSEVQQVSAIHIDGPEAQRNAGLGQFGFDNDLFFSQANPFHQTTPGLGASVQLHTQTDQASVNSEPSFATNSHAVQAQLDTLIGHSDQGTATDVIRDASNVPESNVGIHGTFIDQGTVGVANAQIGGETSSPRRDGTSADFDFLDLQQFSLLSFDPLPLPCIQGIPFKGRNVSPISDITSNLSQGENQNDQSTLQHNLSFGSQTVAPDGSLVNQSEALSLEQLALLGKATITIDDLPDGYLALTTGTTITLDKDAAGYGWFIDQTPFLSEEFVPSVVSHQLSADPTWPAAGHIGSQRGSGVFS
jgi:hypothetical protein